MKINGFVYEYIRPLFCEGRGPFRWTCMSRDPEDLKVTEQIALEVCKGDNLVERWIKLASEYLLMAAMLIEIKSRMLLPPKKVAQGQEPEDPRAELVRRLLEYEQMKMAAMRLGQLPQYGRDFVKAQVYIEQSLQPRFPDVHVVDLQDACATS